MAGPLQIGFPHAGKISVQVLLEVGLLLLGLLHQCPGVVLRRYDPADHIRVFHTEHLRSMRKFGTVPNAGRTRGTVPGDIIISLLFSVFYGKYRLRFPKIRLVLSAEFVQEG